MALGAMPSLGRLRRLQGGPSRRGGAHELLGGMFPWLEALRLELELVVMAAAGGGKDPRGGRELALGMDRGGLGELIPGLASARRRPGRRTGAWPRRRRRRPPPAPTGAREGTSQGDGPGQARRQVRVSHFFLFLFFCFANYCFANYFSSKTKSKNYFRPPEILL